ncbi:hypothetical protein [Micromonospora endophytica]|uniref:Uncharacterized protein n=1 Tax=Micromonospora endophytica TaxID=515350 RepID=A0A2W2C4I2_9ACTN|nr:hypothetical protein [Micromonospora endophytica]PZF92700.1 hypothetical protein C1I93_19075 [Micromonospora endophytica]RIW45450.1 hypothetical protein D3H59_15345 [Micromonospora endophytica]BCJ58594.1 hypothetical protein Jiend_20160 [Micromonospora endophytica]
MIPEEDRQASWLRGYGGIEADIQQMREFADRLRAEVDNNYAAHLPYIANDMLAKVPNPADAFIELVHFMRAHWETQQAAANAVWGLGHSTGHLADAAGQVADRYGSADAFSAARVTDIQQALKGTGVASGQSGQSGPSPSFTDPTGPESAGPVVLP